MLGTRKLQLYLLLTLLAFSAFTVPAQAYSVSAQLTGAGGAEYGLGSNYAYGEYLMPYYLSINGAAPTAVTCDDYLHTVSVGDHWTATVSTFADLSQTRFGTAHALQYQEAIWIASQINSHSLLSDIAGAQFAIWNLLTPGAPSNIPGEAGWIASAEAAASGNFSGMNFANWLILTPSNPLSPQEYFYEIPEPGIYLDLGFGLLAFAAIWTVQRKRQSAVLN